MRFHREGKRIIAFTTAVVLALAAVAFFTLPLLWGVAVAAVLVVLLILVLQFFRVPQRRITLDDRAVLCPADGVVVAIEPTTENEYLKDERIQVSIFMSPLNVHINWYPVSGQVTYSQYHKGKYLVAWHPKSSTDNERTTVAVRHEGSGHHILFRQIAGAVARRIICYARKGDEARQGSEFGFIKFGSRVDVFLPLGSEVHVQLNQKVQGSQTVLATLPTKS